MTVRSSQGITANSKKSSVQVTGKEGMIADITMFNLETVAEGSDYKTGMNGLPPIGLPHVIVNGQFVKRNNKATNVMAGQQIRFPVEEKGRFVPATTEQWLKDFSLVDSGAVRPRDMK
jgi:N-acyl-D-amino-acid deacylase